MLLEVRRELLVDDALDRAFDFGVPELGLGLSLELRLANFHRENGGQSFAHVVTRQSEIRLLERAALRRVVVDRTRQRGLEAREVRPALMGVDVVHERINVLVVAVVVLEGELDVDAVALSVDIYDFLMEYLLLVVEELH